MLQIMLKVTRLKCYPYDLYQVCSISWFNAGIFTLLRHKNKFYLCLVGIKCVEIFTLKLRYIFYRKYIVTFLLRIIDVVFSYFENV